MGIRMIHRSAVLAMALAMAGFAQTSSEAVVISPSFVVEGRVVTGVPYTARAVTSVKQKLATGSEISTEMIALVARDAEGRTRREQTLQAIGPWALRREPSQTGESPTVVIIQDPVKLVNYTLDPRTHLARMSPQRNIGGATGGGSSSELEAARARENIQREEAARREGRSEPRSEPRSERPQERTQSLGERKIEGLRAEGKRTTTTLPAGSIGNSVALEIVVETWYSPELQVVVLGTRSDPRVGDMTYRLVNIKRDDPPPALFEVPAGYRIEGERKNPEERRKD